MRFVDHFLRSNSPVGKTTYVFNEPDRDLVAAVFPDDGFRTYFPGFAVRILADGLREAGVKSLGDRFVHPVFGPIPVLTSTLETAWREAMRTK